MVSRFLFFEVRAELVKEFIIMNKGKHPDTGFHIGNQIKAELERQGRTITWLALQVYCTRENMYRVFRRPWINTDLLFRICEALNCDFFKQYSEYYNSCSVKKKDNP